MRQFDDTNELSPKLYFLFDKDKLLKKARIEQMNIGSYEFDAIIPFEEKTFTDQDWTHNNCEIIDADILNDGSNFLSFSKNLIDILLNQEIDILDFLGYKLKPGAAGSANSDEPDDDDFDDE